MNAMLPHLYAAGLLMLALVVINLFVPRRFGWKKDMASLTLLNRQIFEVHSIFIILLLGLLGTLLLTCGPALLEPTPLARAILIGLCIFWGLRLVMQFFYYSPALWRGKRFETTMHVVFSTVWAYLVAVFSIALLANLRS